MNCRFLFSGLFLGAIVSAFAPLIIKILFGIKFMPSLNILRGLGITVGIWPIIMFSGLLFIGFNQQGYYFITTAITAVLSVLFTLYYIHAFGFQGVAYTFPSVGVISTIVSLVYLKKMVGKKNVTLHELFSPHTLITSMRLSLFQKKN